MSYKVEKVASGLYNVHVNNKTFFLDNHSHWGWILNDSDGKLINVFTSKKAAITTLVELEINQIGC